MDTKEKKKWIVTALVCVIACLFIGCSGVSNMSVSTSLEINNNFRGQRVMSAVLPSSVFRQVFDSDLDALEALVTLDCPSTLRCTVERTSGGVGITMTLDFASLKDYTNKVGQILGRTPGIYYDTSNTLFKNGYMLQENFTSKELFGWLVESLQEKYPQFADMTLEDIFRDGDTRVVYMGEEITTEPKIHVEQMESHAFDTLSVELTMNEDGSYRVAINFIVSQDVYYDMGDDMDAAIRALMPQGGVYEVTDVDKQRVYTIGFSSYNTDTLITQLNAVLQTENCEFKVTETGDADDPFRAHREIEMYLDGSYFLDFTKENSSLVYLLRSDSDFSFDSCESLTGFLKSYYFDSDGEYTSVYMTASPSDKVRVGLTYAVDIKSIEIDTRVAGGTAMDRIFSFTFDADTAALAGENFKNKLQARMDESMVLEVQDSGNVVTYTVNLHGDTPEELSLKTTQFLDGSTGAENLTSTISGGLSEKKKLRVRTYNYEDLINLEGFLGSASVSDGIVYRMEYPKGYVAAYDEGSLASTVVEDNVLTCTTRDAVIKVQSWGETANIAGITQLVIWWVSLIFTVLGLILNIHHIAGFIRHRGKYLLKTEFFKGKNKLFMTIGVVAFTVFLFTSLRILFKVY